ncbi:c-type cytochrome biogenesis protein CcmI [Nostoc sp. CHAB 5834]|nr:c-type cytochrome biogenesis protein CcmI [Nostoc sp. CHAB 5834]
MTLWIVLTVLVSLAAVGLVVPLIRPRPKTEAATTPVGILKDQLAELDTQVASGAMSESDAGRLRIEIERRMLSEAGGAEPEARPLGDRTTLRLALGLAAVVAISGTLLYAFMGNPGVPGASRQAALSPVSDPGAATHPGGDVTAMIAQLETAVQRNDRDVESWRLLGWSYFQTGRFDEAAQAYGRAAALDPRDANHPSSQGEALVQAAGGQVTPAAAAAFNAATAIDPNDPRARYFLAVRKDQSGDRDGAMADWISIVNAAPPGAPWAGEVRRFVEDVARERGIDISGRLTPATTDPAVGSPGPDAAQVAAAAAMDPADRDAMVLGMVESLEARLRTQPRDAEGWVRLMRARMVLGDTAAAARAYASAQAAFIDNAAERERLAQAALGLGVPGVS